MYLGGAVQALREDGGPVVLDAGDGPAARVGPLERLLGPARVVELPLAVVVVHEHPKERRVLMLGELEHRDVAVRVTDCEDRSASGPAPDADRLLRAIVEIVGLCLVRDRATSVVAHVFERGCTTDHPLTRDAIHLLAD